MDIARFKLSSGEVPCIAVFLTRPHGRSLHTGIVYRDAKGNLRRLHLGWQRNLLTEQVCPPSLGCSIPVLDPVDLVDEQFIAGFCGRIARSLPNKQIPYNLKIDNEVKFNSETGDIEIGTNFTGMSCATSVVAVFRSAGNPLVDTVNWPPPTAERRQIQERFVEALAASPDPDYQAQAATISPEIGTPSIAPEHVAGACLEDTYPVKHTECDANGREIIMIIDGAHQQPPPPHQIRT